MLSSRLTRASSGSRVASQGIDLVVVIFLDTRFAWLEELGNKEGLRRKRIRRGKNGSGIVFEFTICCGI